MVVASIASILRVKLPMLASEMFAYSSFRFLGRRKPRKDKMITSPEFMRESIMKARKNFSRDSTSGPRVDIA